ncbi:MAG: hypothetical protein IJC18_02015, partial [Clostridia bacterium]|nr:hypothetical protein [Clostridia bacterium]
MGFEFEDAIPQENKELGFETDSTDLDNGQVSGTSTVKASRRRQRPQPEVKSGMGRSGTGSNEPDSSRARPIRQVAPSGSYGQPRMMKENSEFGYLFTDEEPEDTHMTSAFANRLDGLAYDEKQDGEGEQYDELFSEPQQTPMVKRGFTSRGKKAKAEAAEASEPEEKTSTQEAEASDFKSRFSKRMKKKDKGKEEKSVEKEPTIIESQDTAVEPFEPGDDPSMQAAPYPYPYPPQYPYGQQYQQYPPYPYPYPQPYPYPPQYPYQPQYSYPPQAPYPPQYGYPPQQVYAVMQPIGYIYQPGASQPMSP